MPAAAVPPMLLHYNLHMFAPMKGFETSVVAAAVEAAAVVVVGPDFETGFESDVEEVVVVVVVVVVTAKQRMHLAVVVVAADLLAAEVCSCFEHVENSLHSAMKTMDLVRLAAVVDHLAGIQFAF